MAIKYTPIYTNEYEYMLDLARSSELYRDDAFRISAANHNEEDYAYALAGTKTKTSDTRQRFLFFINSGHFESLHFLL